MQNIPLSIQPIKSSTVHSLLIPVDHLPVLDNNNTIVYLPLIAPDEIGKDMLMEKINTPEIITEAIKAKIRFKSTLSGKILRINASDPYMYLVTTNSKQYISPLF